MDAAAAEKHLNENEKTGTRDEEEPQFSIARSNALMPLLAVFGVTVLAIVITVVRDTPFVPAVGAVADKAFGPDDFPALFENDESLAGLDDVSGDGSNAVFPVPAPPFTEGIFPCMQCHSAIPPNPERRALGMHSNIDFKHDAEHRWCLDCHDKDDRNHLRLANGTLVPFTESYRLCGQCHGTQFRDWRSGIHGKRTGFWNGAKRYLLCVHCHNPHSPKFAQLKPLPPPVRPQFLTGGSEVEAAAAGKAVEPAGAEGRGHEDRAG